MILHSQLHKSSIQFAESLLQLCSNYLDKEAPNKAAFVLQHQAGMQELERPRRAVLGQASPSNKPPPSPNAEEMITPAAESLSPTTKSLSGAPGSHGTEHLPWQLSAATLVQLQDRRALSQAQGSRKNSSIHCHSHGLAAGPALALPGVHNAFSWSSRHQQAAPFPPFSH
ncbi:hypothetical protein WJX84_005948 [Apatococcus fuscideae]|uniref:Uncharacterized protein n=1 Tax=Apatococcus fuscideae TaxID=2026836 RepID=A0AAW1RF49_9CHLO